MCQSTGIDDLRLIVRFVPSYLLDKSQRVVLPLLRLGLKRTDARRLGLQPARPALRVDQ